MMTSNVWYTLYLLILGIIAVFTKELVTFVMLGLILISLQNINSNLKGILKAIKENKTTNS